MSAEVEIGVRLDEATARRKIGAAKKLSQAAKRDADGLRRPGRNPRVRTGGGSGASQGAIVGVLVVGLVASLVGAVVVEAVEEFLDESGLDEILPVIARLREAAKRWGIPLP